MISDKTTGVVLYIVGGVEFVIGAVDIVSAAMAPGRESPPPTNVNPDTSSRDLAGLTGGERAMGIALGALGVIMGVIIIHGGSRLRS